MKVRAWMPKGKIHCMSQLCDEECPRYEYCPEYEIEIKNYVADMNVGKMESGARENE